MILKDNIAIVYGAGGDIGRTVAHSFASEGARVFACGRTLAAVEAVVREIVALGGTAEAAEVDALDERSVEAHIDDVVAKAGRVDISFNAIGIPPREILGTPLAEISLEKFLRAGRDYLAAYFITARAAARRMIPQKSGVIMVTTALPSRLGFALNGGYGAGQGAKDALTRDLSAELSPHGIRVVGIRPNGIPSSSTMREVYDTKAKSMGISFDQFSQYLAGSTHSKRGMQLDDIGGVAAFLASNQASGMTGTNVNLTMGAIDD